MSEELVIKITGSIKDFQDKLDDAKKQSEQLEDALSTTAKYSAVAFGVLTAAIGGAVNEFRESEQAQIKTRAIIEATGGAAGITAEEIFKMSEALSSQTTYTDDAILSGQNLLLTFKNIGSETFPTATEAMLDMAITMGGDVKGAAIQLGKALNDPIQGVSALNRVGVTFTEAQKDQIKVLQDSGRLQEAQAVILKELSSQFGGTAKAAAQGTGSFIQLKNSVGELVEELGKQFAPILISLAQNFKSFIDKIRENEPLVQFIAKASLMAATLAGIGTVVGTVGTALIGFRAILKALEIQSIATGLAIKSMFAATIFSAVLVYLPEIIEKFRELFQVIDKGKQYSGVKQITEDIEKLRAKQAELMEQSEKAANAPGWKAALDQRIKGIQTEIDLLEKKRIQMEDDAERAKEFDQAQSKKQAAEVDSGESERLRKEREESQKRMMIAQQELEYIRAKDEEATSEELDFLKRKQEIERGYADAKLIKNEQEKQAELALLREKHDILLAEEEDYRIRRNYEKEQDREREAQLNAELQALDAEQRAVLKEKDLEEMKAHIQTKDDIERESIKKTLADKRAEDKEYLKNEKEFGTAYAELKRFTNSRVFQGAASAAAEMAQLQNSSNKELKAIGKAFAVSDILIQGILSAQRIFAGFSTIPIIGPALGTAGAAAAIAGSIVRANDVRAMAKGGLLEGGIPGVDSIPVLAQRGELVSPRSNFEEVIGSVRAKREAEKIQQSPSFQGGTMEVIIGFKDNAFEIIEKKLLENRALGVGSL